jgi:hypothetical protein
VWEAVSHESKLALLGILHFGDIRILADVVVMKGTYR